jgi:hypothetical protein
VALSRLDNALALRYGMEILESLMYIAIGFVPTLLAIEVAWRMGLRSGYRAKEVPKIGVR